MSIGGNTNFFLKNYIEKRYFDLCEEVLSRELKNYHNLTYKSNGINFKEIFEDLIFVTLYENNSFDSLKENIKLEIYYILNNLSENEINLLFLKNNSFSGIVDEDEVFEYIAEEMFTVIIDKLVDHLSNLSKDKYSLLSEFLVEDIMKFAFNGSVAGDYNTSNYWEEYCVILQEGYDDLYELCKEDIYDHIVRKLRKLSKSDLTLLYSGTDEIYVNNYNNPLSRIDISVIADKLYKFIELEASLEDISHFLYPDEDDE